MPYKILFFSILLLLAGSHVCAQNTFEEGVILYDVTVYDEAHSEVRQSGTYTVSIKGSYIRKDLELFDGYESIILLNSRKHTIYALKNDNQNKFAIQLSYEDYAKEHEQYDAGRVAVESEQKTISGINAKKAYIQYRNGTSATLYFTGEWRIEQKFAFERFNALGYVPVSFEYKNNEGTVMYFKIKSIEQGPVATSIFHVPADYKIISSAEYKEMNK